MRFPYINDSCVYTQTYQGPCYKSLLCTDVSEALLQVFVIPRGLITIFSENRCIRGLVTSVCCTQTYQRPCYMCLLYTDISEALLQVFVVHRQIRGLVTMLCCTQTYQRPCCMCLLYTDVSEALLQGVYCIETYQRPYYWCVLDNTYFRRCYNSLHGLFIDMSETFIICPA